MRVAITGSSGLIGSALAERLELRGHQVLRMRRGPEEDPRAVWDPASGWIRPGALAEVDAIVNLGGSSIGNRWTASRKRMLWTSRIDATRLLVDHLRAAGIRPGVLVSASAVGYYGDRGDEVLDESSSPGDDFLARLCVAWEAEARRAEDLGARVVLSRTGVAFDRTAEAFRKLVLPVRLGVGGRLGSGRQWFPWVHLEDQVRVIEAMVADERYVGPVNVAAPELVTNAQLTRQLGRVLGRPTLFPVPPLALRLLLGEMADALLLASARVQPKVLQSRGFEWRYPDVDSALRAATGKRVQ